ncbi:MAG: hypothetical protein LAT64_04570 [Phycisphaerales bacterium]|nr:hypothetical protein [Planctomycetota bacterium]MCH8508027.1 hypothetical protein [Phycisphaerales bacterium]
MADPCRIRFCVLNPRSNQERDALVAEGCEMRDCLGQCSLCFETRFLEAGQTIIDEPDDYAELLDKARRLCAERARGQPAAS